MTWISASRALAIAAVCLTLAACGGAAPAGPTAPSTTVGQSAPGDASPEDTSSDSPVDDAVDGVEDLLDDGADGAPQAEETTDALAHITTCEQVAALTQGLTDGLVLTESSGVDEYGVWCSWDEPDPEDFANIRSVEVIGEPYDQTDAMLTAAELADANLEHLPDPAIEAAGGIAYGNSAQTAVATVMTVGVLVPDASISIAGGGWGPDPHVSNEIAISIAKGMLRL